MRNQNKMPVGRTNESAPAKHNGTDTAFRDKPAGDTPDGNARYGYLLPNDAKKNRRASYSSNLNRPLNKYNTNTTKILYNTNLVTDTGNIKVPSSYADMVRSGINTPKSK